MLFRLSSFYGLLPGIFLMGFPPVLTYGSPGIPSMVYPRYFRIDRVSPGTNGFFPGTLWVLPCTCVRGTVAPQPFGLVPELGYSPLEEVTSLKSARAPVLLPHFGVRWDLLESFPFLPCYCTLPFG